MSPNDMQRTMPRTLLFCLFTFLTACMQTVHADPAAEAKQLFERYASLEARFDPGVAALNTDDAVIRNKRFYPVGCLCVLLFLVLFFLFLFWVVLFLVLSCFVFCFF